MIRSAAVAIGAVAVILGICSCSLMDDDSTGCSSDTPASKIRDETPLRATGDVEFADTGLDVTTVMDVTDARDAKPVGEFGLEFEWAHSNADDYVAADPETVSADCRLIASHHVFGSDPLTDFEQEVGVRDSSGFDELASTTEGNVRWQAYSYAWLGDDPIWLETTSTNLDWADWRIRRSQGGQVATVADSASYFESSDPPPIVGMDSYVSASADRVVWNTADPVEREAVLLMWGGGEVRELERGTWLHAADGDSVYYIHSQSPKQMAMIRVDGAGRKEEILDFRVPADRSVTRFAVDGDKAVISFSGSLNGDNGSPKQDARLVVVDLHTKKSIVVRAHGEAMLSVDISDDIVAFGPGSSNGDPGIYLLHLRSRTLEHLEDAAGLGRIGVEGSVVAWQFVSDLDQPGVKVARVG